MSISLFIAGDVVPMNRTKPLFKNRQKELLFGEISKEINADLNIVNFEAPIVNGEEVKPIKKSGPALRTSIETLQTLHDVGFNIITLANNHFRDYGQSGVEDTLNAATELNIQTIGGGLNCVKAREFYYNEINGEKIAIINACENEFSIATETYGGSNPVDLINIQEDIEKAKRIADYIILIIHGGIEHYNLPTPRMKKWYHHFIDLGADVIINHHQHCFSGYENYKGKLIFYGLGNFQFDSMNKYTKTSKWEKGYAVKLELKGKNITYDLIPYEQNATDPTIKLRPTSVFQKEIEKLNRIITDNYLLETQFNEFVLSKKNEILLSLFPMKSKITDSIGRRGWFAKLLNRKKVIALKNLFSCESHNEETKQLFSILSLY